MPAYFLDSSALVKAYRREAGTDRVTQLLAGGDPIVVARLAQVEVSSAIVRRGREAGIATADIQAVLAELDRELLNSFDVVELTAAIVARATALTRTHAIRAADAIQLACALSAREAVTPEQLVLVGSDVELNGAAGAEGLAVLDPTQP
jgi:predicted nucleic acid-binding protein